MNQAKDPQQYYKQLQGITMREDRKRAMREELSAYADFATGGEAVRDATSERLPWYTQLFVAFRSLKQKRMIKVGILIAVLVTSGGATSYAAQDSVPGDTLYPVKVHVNENVQGALAVGANAEAQHQAQLLAERITEAETLLERDALTSEHAATLSARIGARAEVMNQRSAQADATVQAEVRNNTEAKLGALQTRLAAKGDDTAASLTVGLEQARSVIQLSGDGAGVEVEADTEQQLESVVDTEARVQQARDSLEQAADVSAEARADLDAKLDTAVEAATEARADIETNASATVQDSLDAAAALIEEVETELRTRGTTSIETESSARGDTSAGSADEVEAGDDTEAGIRVEPGTTVDTEGVEVEGTQDIEAESGVRSGI